MKTKSQRFVEERREEWKDLLEILKKISRKGVKKLDDRELERFPGLYRKVCQDLAEARMLKLSPDVLEYLNSLTGTSHKYLYFVKPLTLKGLKSFFKEKLLFTILDNWKVVLTAFLLFWGAALGTYFTVTAKPEMAVSFMNESTLESVSDMYSESTAGKRTRGQNISMAAFYIQHNTSIAFLCFATGIFFGLGSVYFLVYNGIFLGCIAGHLTNLGLDKHLWEFVTAHSFMELNAIAIAGGAGLLMGITIIKAWKNYSRDYLKGNKEPVLVLVAAAAIMLFIAAMIEGFLSPTEVSYSVKLSVMLLSAVAFVWYFVLLPLRKRGAL